MCPLPELTALNPPYKTLPAGTPERVVIWDKSFSGSGLKLDRLVIELNAIPRLFSGA